MDPDKVQEAVDEAAELLRADGGDLVLVSADPATRRIELRLVVEGASCAECILPADLLKQVIEDAITRRTPGQFELILHDPRIGTASAH